MNFPSLDALTFSLNQHAFIEASAGTGKTWTIAALFVRLIVEKNLSPKEILVLTFTTAATEELKNRIHARLIEAASAFEGNPADDFLKRLTLQTPEEKKAECARKLYLAAQIMDEAKILTIHAWCLSILKSAALSVGAPFALELIEEEKKEELKHALVAAYWREFYAPLPVECAQMVLELWQSPTKLLDKIAPLFKHPEFIPQNFNSTPQEIIQNQQKEVENIQQEIIENFSKIEDLILFLKNAQENKNYDGRKFPKKTFNQCEEEIKEFKEKKDLSILKKCFEKFNQDFLKSIWKYEENFNSFPVLDLFSKWREDLENEEYLLKKELYLHAAFFIQKETQKHYQRHNQEDFDSLLKKCQKALDENPHLVTYLRKQFPFALIDEFQDTDPIQCAIFEKIYPFHQNENILILIGDPKQAIYAFRGADVYSYLTMRQKLKHSIQTLNTNYRAVPEALAVTHSLFHHAENNIENGAFGFKKERENQLPFLEIQASPKNEHLKRNNTIIPSFNYVYLKESEDKENEDKKNNAEERKKKLAEQCAHYLKKIFHQNLYFENEENKRKRPFTPADCAILVNSGNEARLMKNALKKYGIPSAYLSEKESVYAETIAQELYLVLEAILNRNKKNIHTALCTRILNENPQKILNLTVDENLLEEMGKLFLDYADYWQKNGVQALIHKLLFDFHTPQKCLTLHNGNRILTDIRHLAELLQTQSVAFNSPHALLEYFNYKINHLTQTQVADEQLIRLETDENIVQIITIHKSKGLEFSFVLLPFLFKNPRFQHHKDYPVFYHDEHNQLNIHWENNEEIKEKVKKEELLENTRKLYVALTRARHALYLGFDSADSTTKNPENNFSAFARLIHSFDENNLENAFFQWIKILNKESFTENVLSEENDLIKIKNEFNQNNKEKKAPLEIQNYQNDFYGIASFSNLMKNTQNYSNENDENKEKEKENPFIPKEFTVLKNFPKGAEFGNTIHQIFEKLIPSPDFFNVNKNESAFSFLKEEEKNDYKEWFKILSSNPLPIEEKLSLKDLNPKLMQAEMEFYFPIPHFNLDKLETLIQQHILPQHPREKTQKKHLNGMMKGYMDLIFSVNNRYYLLDYKTNFLGENIRDYSLNNIQHSFLSHRYDLQMAIYLWALHQFLKTRILNYSPEKHIGGAIYYYLRGVENEESKGFFYFSQCAPLLNHLHQLF